jgi:hypothetical protein
MTASVSMVIFNKLVMQTFPYPNLLLIIQNSITILLNVVGTQAGAFPPPNGPHFVYHCVHLLFCDNLSRARPPFTKHGAWHTVFPRDLRDEEVGIGPL